VLFVLIGEPRADIVVLAPADLEVDRDLELVVTVLQDQESLVPLPLRERQRLVGMEADPVLADIVDLERPVGDLKETDGDRIARLLAPFGEFHRPWPPATIEARFPSPIATIMSCAGISTALAGDVRGGTAWLVSRHPLC
jgi:hypothetical protein